MLKLLLPLITLLSLAGIYDQSIPASGGGSTIAFSSFQGKKILIVNTASNSLFTAQYGRLEQLYQQYPDSLVIVAVPSNDFGHEPGNDSTIAAFVQNTYHIHYVLATKSAVTGTSQSSLYGWLTSFNQNGAIGSTVTWDFQKYLLDAQGHLLGCFAGPVDPMDSSITALISGQ